MSNSNKNDGQHAYKRYIKRKKAQGYNRHVYFLTPKEKELVDNFVASLRPNTTETISLEDFQKIQWGPKTNERTKAIAKEMLVDGYKQFEIAERYGLSRERTRAIAKHAKELIEKQKEDSDDA